MEVSVKERVFEGLLVYLFDLSVHLFYV